uniref:NADH dehydrogenase subunit 6 n=1 Tax=Caulophacus iocasicus TaxID=3031190 RepID=UPI0023F0C031|nr:NADH dehydrogenase subunit 6 [Caulophacus iocasicus]WDY83519.1 NADH dehydrogenase subunit 6 [Caulophacus iocasicus]
MTTILCINIILTRLIISTTTRTIYRAIWLILAFINAALLLIIIKIEFLAILIIIVYVGAIAILFLFAIMMLNLNIIKLKQENTNLLPIRILIIITLTYKIREYNYTKNTTKNIRIDNENNIEKIRELIYSNLRPWLIIRRFILLISMISSIIIINKENTTSIKQHLYKQIHRIILK